jgi:hypothetical protein
MLYDHSMQCQTREEFDLEIEKAYQLCLETSLPIQISGHCSPTKPKSEDKHVKPGNGTGGIMFSIYVDNVGGTYPDKQIIYHVFTNFPIENEVFDINYDLKKRLRSDGKIVCYWDWEDTLVTHILSVRYNAHDWKYGLIANDTDAIIALLKCGSGLRRGKLAIS